MARWFQRRTNNGNKTKRTMIEEFVTFETAKLLKEKGFDEPCMNYFTKEGFLGKEIIHSNWTDEPCFNNAEYNDFVCTQPTQALVMRWLREVHNIVIVINIAPTCNSYYWFKVFTYSKNNELQYTIHSEESYSTYEEACENAIKHCIRMI